MEQTSRLAIVQLSPFQKRDVSRRLVFVVDLPPARNARNCPRAYREFPRGALIAFGVCEFRTKLITFRPERWCDWRHLVHFHATTKQKKIDSPQTSISHFGLANRLLSVLNRLAGEELAVLIEWLIDWRTRFKRSKSDSPIFAYTQIERKFRRAIMISGNPLSGVFDGSRRA